MSFAFVCFFFVLFPLPFLFACLFSREKKKMELDGLRGGEDVGMWEEFREGNQGAEMLYEKLFSIKNNLLENVLG